MANEEKTQLFAHEGGEAKLPPPYLIIVDGPHKGARFPIKSEGLNQIGRLEECDIVLDDQSVSRKHAHIKREEQGWVIEDLQSKNGTVVNGSAIAEPVVIGHKDLLRFGIYTLRFVAQEIDSKEEMEVPADVGDWGTLMVGEEGKEGDTRRLGPHRESAGGEGETSQSETGKLVTAPHSPLEEPQAKKSPLFKPRLWILAAGLFAVVLSVGLFIYWKTILAPEEVVVKKTSAPKVVGLNPQGPSSELAVVALGPPKPEPPKTIPIFLDCVANPFPATVVFEEKEIGKTPLKVNVELTPEKEYPIEARFEMEEIQETYTDHLSFKISPDQSMIPLLFHAPVGTLKIADLPRDVSLYLEAYFSYNRFQGKPIKLQNIVLNKPIYVPYGRYILELRRSENIIYRREFELKEEKPTSVVAVTDEGLSQFPATIRSIPPGADVFVDQVKVGVTPFEGTLPVGKHTLTLRREGYFESSQEMASEINTPFKTEVTLRTSAAGEKINQGKTFLNNAAYENALQVLSQVFDLNPTEGETAETRYLLGKVYLGSGDYPKAAGYFEQVTANDKYKYWGKLGQASVFAAQNVAPQALVPLVEVLLNAKEEDILKEARDILHAVSPLRSVVYIQTDPVGATVYLNEKKLEQVTPILLHEMSLGSYRLRLEKPGYQPLNLTINLSVNEFNPVLAKLKKVSQ